MGRRTCANRLTARRSCLLLLLFMTALSSVHGSKAPSFRELYFTVEPSDTITARDQPATLDCIAVGDPAPLIKWKRDGIDLNFVGDARRSILANGSLHFTDVRHTRSEQPDEGIYQCVASIGLRDVIVSRSAKLQVASLPRFDEQPRDVTIFPQQTARFACAIQGIPPATITWLKDELPLQLDPVRMTVLPSGALEIDHVQVGDEGNYRCNASNLDRHRVSQVGSLSVNLDTALSNKIAVPLFVAVPQDVLVKEGSMVTLDCAANGNPRPKITWLKNGVTIDLNDLDGRFYKVGTGNLQIHNVMEADQGDYMCRAGNHEDSIDASATLDIQVPPRFIKRPSSRHAYIKEDVELECEIYGRPEPTVQWLKNGDLILESDYFQLVNGHNLKILGLVTSDTSIYQCVGSNPAGNIQVSAQLVILKPESLNPTTVANFPHTDATITTDGGNPAQETPSAPRDLAAAIISTRFVTLTWQPPTKPAGEILSYSVYFRPSSSLRERVVNTTRLRLEELNIRGLKSATTYFFRVLAYNQHGPGESSEEIEVKTQPEVHVPNPPENLHAFATSPTAILVQWSPPHQNGPIDHYKLYYMEVGTSEEHEVETTTSPYVLWGLDKYTEYSIWVAAVNQNGPGLSAEEVAVRTYSDVPSETPQNVTLEAASSTSIIVRWEPPPKGSANGVITGYKIQYKLKGNRGRETVTTDGNRRLYALINLERRAEYSIRMSAMTVNGTGPFTEWMVVETYQNDLDESRVPDPPNSLKARPNSNSIIVNWTPPRNQNIMVRGYTIGWGIGVPDVYTKVLDGKQRYYQIDNLHASSEYVISLRAYNQMGDGQPIYETVKTRINTTPEPLTPMYPPVGLKAIVLSPTSVVLYWADSTLPKSQQINDNRYYTVRFTTYFTTNPRYKYFNATDLNCMIDDLKPNTQYEFSVKVIKGRRESTWSLNILNTTHEAAPTSPPRDLTVVAVDSNPAAIILNWQPPKQPNGQITGYVIFYTTDNTQKERDWVVEGVVGDKMTASIRGLTPNTTYYFKIQARNNKGYGPLSQMVVFRTGASGVGVDNPIDDSAFYSRDGLGGTSNPLYIIIACVSGATLLFIVGVTVVICRRRNNSYNNDRKKKGYLSKVTGKCKSDIKPPDLWIHHDRMELKDADKARNMETTMTVTPIPRNSQDLDVDEKIHRDSLEKRAPAYIAIATATPIPNGSLSQHGDSRDMQSGSRPIYPRTQYNIPRAHVSIDTGPGGSGGNSPELPSPGIYNQQVPVPYDQVAGHPAIHPMPIGSAVMGTGQVSSYSAGPCSNNPDTNGGTLGKRPAGHPLKSFSVPAPPPQSAPTTPQPKHIVRPQQSASPYKKPSIATPINSTSPLNNQTSKSHGNQLPMVTPRTAPDAFKQTGKDDKLAPSYSSEELTAEMANLEGLMKDLNAITASEFEC